MWNNNKLEKNNMTMEILKRRILEERLVDIRCGEQ